MRWAGVRNCQYLDRDEPGQAALDDHRRRLQCTDRPFEFSEALIKHFPQYDLSDPRQPARPPFQAGQSLASRSQRTKAKRKSAAEPHVTTIKKSDHHKAHFQDPGVPLRLMKTSLGSINKNSCASFLSQFAFLFSTSKRQGRVVYMCNAAPRLWSLC
jgi:hypothetical protein